MNGNYLCCNKYTLYRDIMSWVGLLSYLFNALLTCCGTKRNGSVKKIPVWLLLYLGGLGIGL